MSNTIGVNDLISQMRAMQSQIKEIQSLETNINPNSINEAKSTDNTSAFSNILKESIGKVNEAQAQSNLLQEAFQKGDPNVEVSQVMLAMQKSSVSFQAMVQVRNKIIQAYQEIMNMPV